MMKICVLGLWHLGSVTAACCARHFDVTGLDFDDRVVADLNRGQSPVLEPGLNELLQAGLEKKTLRFTTDAQVACAKAEVLWVCYDTPVNDNDESDTAFVLERLRHMSAVHTIHCVAVRMDMNRAGELASVRRVGKYVPRKYRIRSQRIPVALINIQLVLRLQG